MSIAPPGHETPQASPPPPPPPAPQGAPLSHKDAKAQAGSRQADDHVKHEFKSVQALRGRESRAKAKWHDQGWEFVSENRGTLRTELNFRRVKPKTFGTYLLSSVATLRRLQPKTQLALVASCALILAAGTIGIVVGTQSGGDTRKPSAAQTTASTAPPAEPTVTGITDNEPLDDAEPSETSKPSETPSETAEPDATESSEPNDEARAAVRDDDYAGAMLIAAALGRNAERTIERRIARRLAFRIQRALQTNDRGHASRLLSEASAYPRTVEIRRAAKALHAAQARAAARSAASRKARRRAEAVESAPAAPASDLSGPSTTNWCGKRDGDGDGIYCEGM
jgi:hypothetical protein